MGRKRTRLGFATFAASALAISVTAVGAFQTTLPPTASSRTTTASSITNSPFSWQTPYTGSTSSQLNVLADPEVFLKEQLDFVQAPRPLSGVKKDKRRKVPPRVKVQTVQSRKASSTASAIDNNHSQDLSVKTTKRSVTSSAGAPSNPTATTAAAATSTSTNTTTNNLTPRRQKKRFPRQTSTMPGFQNGGAHTGRQKAFRDGIKLVEGRTGKKLTQYVDTPAMRKKRRQVNGEAMYKSSASVPDSLVQFANEIHTVDRITPKEEIELGTLTQEAIRLQTLHEDLTDQLERPPTDEEWCAAAGKINLEAVSQAIEDGLEAKNKLVTSNLRMVQGVVNLYIRNGLGGQYNAGDLMQEGIMVR